MQCKIVRRVDMVLQRHIPRYKLWRISKAIGIKPYPWQRDFAMRKTDSFGDAGMFRQTGKTMAVMLRIMMRTNMYVEPHMFADDPDWLECDLHRIRWYYNEYHRLSGKCFFCGVFVPLVPLNNPLRRKHHEANSI